MKHKHQRNKIQIKKTQSATNNTIKIIHTAAQGTDAIIADQLSLHRCAARNVCVLC